MNMKMQCLAFRGKCGRTAVFARSGNMGVSAVAKSSAHRWLNAIMPAPLNAWERKCRRSEKREFIMVEMTPSCRLIDMNELVGVEQHATHRSKT